MNVDFLDDDNTTEEIALNITGKKINARIKTGDALIPKTSFAPLAAPEKIYGVTNPDIEFLRANMRYVYEDIMRIFVAAKIPIFLWGPPGSGKTRSVEAMGKEHDEDGRKYQVITVQPSTQDPTVIYGLMTITEDPRTEQKIMHRSVPEIAERVNRYYNDKDGLTILFLDEMTTCSPAQQNAMLGLLTHGKYGDIDISNYVTFVLAANPPGTVQNVLELSEAIINRGGHIPWYSSPKLWFDKWVTGFGDPAKEPSERTRTFIHHMMNADPDIVFRYDPETREDDDGWTPDNLCPYPQMETSERVFTQLADVYAIITKAFEDSPFEIRQLYLTECTRAICGPRWAAHAATIEEILDSEISVADVVRRVSRAGITKDSTIDTIRSSVGDSLHRAKGHVMTTDAEVELVDKFAVEIFAGGDLSTSRYLAFWVWLSTMPHEAARLAVLPTVARIIMRASSFTDSISRDKLLPPPFVPQQVKNDIKATMQHLQR